MQSSRKLEEIVDTIASDREKLLDAVSGLSESQFDYRITEDQWSISDILHHLMLADDASVKLSSIILKQAAERELPADAAPDESVLGCINRIAEMAASQKAKAPDRVAPRTHLPAIESLERLRASRERLVEAATRLSAYDLRELTFPHPFFGDLNPYQWLLLAGWHERRHAAQIDKIKSNPDFPSR